MKPILLAVLFLMAILVGCFTSIYYISTQAASLHVQLIDLEKYIESENWNDAYSLFKDFKKKWHNVDHKWSMLIDHYEIDYINMDLGELEAFIKTKDKSNALAKVSSLQLLVQHIPDKEYPTLKNIL